MPEFYFLKHQREDGEGREEGVREERGRGENPVERNGEVLFGCTSVNSGNESHLDN